MRLSSRGFLYSAPPTSGDEQPRDDSSSLRSEPTAESASAENPAPADD